MNVPLTILEYGTSLLGSLLPDIDTTSSSLGKLFHPVSTYIERRFGHRTITHSLLGCSIFGLIGVPLLMLGSNHLYSCFIFGVVSHVLLDAVNKSGVPLFYPNLARAVIPHNEKYRIFTASKQEFVFFGILSSLTLAILPLNKIGMRGALHSLVRIPQSAVSDYLTYSSQGFETIVDFDGIFNISQRRVKGKWPAVNSTSRNSLLIQSPEGRLYSIGANPHDNIRPLSIQSFKGRPINVLTREITIFEQPLSEVLNFIPKEGQTYLLGYIKTYDKLNLDSNFDEYSVLKHGINRLDFDYARKEDILRSHLANVLANEGKLLIMQIQSSKEKGSFSFSNGIPVSSAQASRVITLYIRDIYNPEKELKIKADDFIIKGELLASQDQKRDKLCIERKEAEERLGIAKSELDKLRIQLEQELLLKQKEDQFLDSERALTLNKRLSEIKLGAAKARVNLASSALDKIQQEINATKIYSSVDGKVLSIRLQHTTAILRILTKESDTTSPKSVVKLDGDRE